MGGNYNLYFDHYEYSVSGQAWVSSATNITDDDDDSLEDVITTRGEDGYDQVAHSDNHRIIHIHTRYNIRLIWSNYSSYPTLKRQVSALHTCRISNKSDISSYLNKVGCYRPGKQPPFLHYSLPLVHLCPLSSFFLSWTRVHRWHYSLPNCPIRTIGSCLQGRGNKSPSLLCK